MYTKIANLFEKVIKQNYYEFLITAIQWYLCILEI